MKPRKGMEEIAMSTRSGKWRRSYVPCTTAGCGRPQGDRARNPHNHTRWIERAHAVRTDTRCVKARRRK